MAARAAIVLGSQGALGRAVVTRLQSRGWSVVGIDITESPSCDTSIVVSSGATWAARQQSIIEGIRSRVSRMPFARAVVCTAGGWAGGGIADDTLAESAEGMFRVCLQPAVDAARLASLFLAPQSSLVLTGAAAALGPTPGMLGYGLAKASTHYLVRSLAGLQANGGALLAAAAADPGLPPSTLVLGVLPGVIDTPSNRQYMAGSPGVDVSTWTPPEHIAAAVEAWCAQHAGRTGLPVGAAARGTDDPASGSLLRVTTAGGTSAWTLH